MQAPTVLLQSGATDLVADSQEASLTALITPLTRPTSRTAELVNSRELRRVRVHIAVLVLSGTNLFRVESPKRFR